MYHDGSTLGLTRFYPCLSLSMTLSLFIHDMGRLFLCLRAGQPRCRRQELLPLYTADVLCATAFGKDLGMLETRKTELVQDVKKLSARHGNRCAFLRMRGCPIQCFVTMEVSWGYPQSSSIYIYIIIYKRGIFHEINHPAIGVPPFMETS